MKASTSWSETPANVKAPPLSPPTTLNASPGSIRSSGRGTPPNSDNDCLILPEMGSSSCCRANHAYEKVPSLGYSQCVQSSTEDSLAVYVHVRTSPGPSPLYAPERIEQRQKNIAREAQIRSSSTRRDIAANLPQHVRSRPHDDPSPHNNTGSNSSRKHIPHESCVQAPPNRSPFALNTTFPTRLNSYSSSCSSNGGSHTSSSSVSSSSSSSSNNSSRMLPSIRNSSYSTTQAVTRFPGYSGKKAI